MKKERIKVEKVNMQLAVDCLVNSLTILAQKGITEADITLNFINNSDLRGLNNYLEAIRKRGEKG